MISGNVKYICSFYHLISKLWFEHFCIFGLFYIWPSHLLKSFISDLESLRKIQSQSLCSIGEDVKGNFGSFSLHVGDESLQICSSFYLNMKTTSIFILKKIQCIQLYLFTNPLNLSLILKEFIESCAVLDDEGGDWEEGEEQHVHHVQPLACLGHWVDLEQSAHPFLLNFS